MRTRLLFPLIALIAIGCNSPQKQLVGKWKISPETLADAFKSLGNSPEVEKQLAPIKKQYEDATVEFTSDGKVISNGLGKSDTATYTLSGHTVTITGGADATSKQGRTLTLSDDGKSLTGQDAGKTLKLVKAS